MDPKGQALLKLLFNEGEQICVSNSQKAYRSIPLEQAMEGQLTLMGQAEGQKDNICQSSDLILCSVNPIKGPRLDCNVTAYRTFLIEIDTGSIPVQIATLKHLKMPWSAQIFSGGKSVHTAIILDEDLPNEKTYRNVFQWIFNIATMIDKNCVNPSRMIRIPGAYREPGKKQRLIQLKKRITHKELFGWLNTYEHLRPVGKPKREIVAGQADYDKLSKWAKNMMIRGINFKHGRNITWFGLAAKFAEAGFTEEEAIQELGKRFEEEYDFKEKEWLLTIASAFKKVHDEQK